MEQPEARAGGQEGSGLSCDHTPRLDGGKGAGEKRSRGKGGFMTDDSSSPLSMTMGDRSAERILVADDDADAREYLTRLLRNRWFVEAVPDGQAALEAAKKGAFDLIVADVQMPRIDGFGLLRSLRENASLRAIPVIMISARA